MKNSSGLRVRQLVLIGYRKNYVIPFHPGVNIIYGDADTGKSSILRIIYYLLGGKQIKLDHELASSVKYACLEICVRGVDYCIQRDLYDANRNVDLYTCSFDQIEYNFPRKLASSLGKSTPELKSLSEFLLEELNFPNVNLKQAPTKDSSDTARLSILDLFKYMYLDQDDVGSTKMLNIGNGVLEVKNREVLKYIFNILDSNISDLEGELSEKTKEKNSLVDQYKVISRFLSLIEFESIEIIDNEIGGIEEETDNLNARLSDLNTRMIGDSELYEGFKDALNSINMDIVDTESKKNDAINNIERFDRLKNDYSNDVDKINSLLKAREVIGKEIEVSIACPVCDSHVELSNINEKFSIPEDDKVKQELNSIIRRTRDITKIINDNQEKIDGYNSLLSELYEERERAKNFLDEELEKSISPYLTERDAIVSELAYLKERREKYRHALKVRNQQNLISDQIGRLESNITTLKEKLETMKTKAPSTSSVLSMLGRFLDSYLEKINIKNRFGVSISEKTFLPVVRNIEYRDINSGGLRTIVSIGYLSVLLKALLINDINHPGLIMIDTVGKFLGKNEEDHSEETGLRDDDKEGMSDPEKYKNIYEYLLDLSEEFENNGKHCQIILVDNDIPPAISNLHKGFEIAHFSTNGVNDLPVGLIDDWDKFVDTNSSR